MRHNSLSLIRLLAAALFILICDTAAQAFAIKEVTSPGGIRAWLVEEHAVPLVAMDFSFQPGSASDPAEHLGVSNFLSGMLDEGAGDLDSQAFQRKRDALAFRMSFDSSKDYFSGSFQTLSRNRDASFDMLRLALTAPRFDPEPLERVRRQILLAIQQKQDDPQSIGLLAWMKLVLPGDLYARMEEGTPETVNAISADDLREARNRIFNRRTLQVAVVGDIDAKTLGPLLDRVFGDLPASEDQAAIAPARMETGPKTEVVSRDMPQSVIIFGHEGIPRDDPDFIPAYVMSQILGGGDFGTRLTEEIRERRGLTYGVSFSLSTMKRANFYFGLLQTRNNAAGEALKLIRQEMEKMAAEGPTQQELDEVKSYLTGSYALRFSSNSAISSQLLGIQQMNLGIDYVTNRNSMIEAVTLEQVKAQARRLLHPDRLLVTIVGKPEGLD